MQKLIEYLKPFSGQYGIGEAKELKSLLDEISEGETVIEWQNGKPIRVVRVARLWVYSELGCLKETHQVFPDGRIRERRLASSLSEKFMPDELPINACKRALIEELQVSLDDCQISAKGLVETKTEISPSYPGLLCQYQFSDFDVFLKNPNSEGYCEQSENGRQTFFDWKK